jgi:hypothetical protein
MKMTSESQLEVALRLVEELSILIEGNECNLFLSQHLIPIQIELERQLTNLQSDIKIKK